MKSKKNILIISTIVLMLSFASAVLSVQEFHTANFVDSGLSVARIVFTDVPLVRIGKNPEVFLTKPDNGLEAMVRFMGMKGYNYSSNESMGSLAVFKNLHNDKIYVDFSVNDYYAKWVFR